MTSLLHCRPSGKGRWPLLAGSSVGRGSLWSDAASGISGRPWAMRLSVSEATRRVNTIRDGVTRPSRSLCELA